MQDQKHEAAAAAGGAAERVQHAVQDAASKLAGHAGGAFDAGRTAAKQAADSAAGAADRTLGSAVHSADALHGAVGEAGNVLDRARARAAGKQKDAEDTSGWGSRWLLSALGLGRRLTGQTSAPADAGRSAAEQARHAAAKSADKAYDTAADAARAAAHPSGHAKAAFRHGEHDAAHLSHTLQDKAADAADSLKPSEHTKAAFRHGEHDAARAAHELSSSVHHASDAAQAVVHRSQQQASEAFHEGEEAAAHATDRVSGAARAAADKAAAAAHAASAHAGAAFRDGEEAAAHLADSAARRATASKRGLTGFLRSAASDAGDSFSRVTHQLLHLVGLGRTATHDLNTRAKDVAADAAGGPIKAAQQLSSHTAPQHAGPAHHAQDEAPQHMLDRILHNGTKWLQDQIPGSPLPHPTSARTGRWQKHPAARTGRLSAALLGARHDGRFGDGVWMATTPVDVHEAPQTAGQALASLLTAGREGIGRTLTCPWLKYAISLEYA